MLAAARKYKSVVQVGTQRRSTPHLSGSKEKYCRCRIAWVKYHMWKCVVIIICATMEIPLLQPVPDFFDYEMWTGPAPLRPYDGLPHVRWWRTFMEYGNGIMGDMCIHMFDAVSMDAESWLAKTHQFDWRNLC